MITTKIGNVLDVDTGIIVHGCNCQGVMGSGVALAVKKKWPKVFETYYNDCRRMTPQSLLGKVGFVWVNHNLVVANAYTQLNFGGPGILHISYDAIRSCFKTVNATAMVDKLPVHFPLIGCDRGGGDWNIVSKIIDEELDPALERTLWRLQ